MIFNLDRCVMYVWAVCACVCVIATLCYHHSVTSSIFIHFFFLIFSRSSLDYQYCFRASLSMCMCFCFFNFCCSLVNWGCGISNGCSFRRLLSSIRPILDRMAIRNRIIEFHSTTHSCPLQMKNKRFICFDGRNSIFLLSPLVHVPAMMAIIGCFLSHSTSKSTFMSILKSLFY